ncbi:MAG: 50S ribosomal protein L2 [Phycisphaerales bacterium]|nr:50S ribosomal protein L2 [Phycisphaerales bacterium]
MTIRIYKRTSPGRRNASVNLHTEVTKKTPEKSLLRPIKKTGGRNHHGKITVRGRGGGHKRRYRKIDFKRRDRAGIPGTVVGIEYDPNRSSHIALIKYEDGVMRYIPAPVGLRDGDTIISSGERVEPSVGNRMMLKNIPTGLPVHCIEVTPGKGGQFCRAAGAAARLTNREERWATLVFPSGEIRQLPVECWATIGQVGNTDHQHRRLGKAGKSRHLGRRPKVRGVAMSHHCHPLGGGEGRSKGNRPPASATGLQAKGGGTRNRKKPSSKRIIRRRKSVRYGQLKT